MKVGDSVRNAIDDWEQNKLDAAMLHACNAVDGSASKHHPKIQGSNARFTQFLRDNYDVLGPMGAPGFDLAAQRWPVTVLHPKASGGTPDLADVIYGIHRCTQSHGDELPDGFELIPDAAGPDRLTQIQIQKGKVRLSDRVIFGLLAVAVMSPANADQKVPDGYFLTFAGERFPINDWWGRRVEFVRFLAREPIPIVNMDFGDWMDGIK